MGPSQDHAGPPGSEIAKSLQQFINHCTVKDNSLKPLMTGAPHSQSACMCVYVCVRAHVLV